MTLRRAGRLSKRYGRTLCGWSALALYLVLALGLPLPTLVGKDTSQPFPCMHSQCGCRNADQCWRSCCCSTLAERLAWAREHGVTPPPLAIAQASAQKIDLDRVAAKKTNCCAKQSGQCHTDKQRHADKPKSCCDEPAGADLGPQDDSVVILQALRCQGQSNSLLSIPPALPAQVVVWTLDVCSRPGGELRLPSTRPLHSPPPVPPPQFAAV